MKIKLKMLAIFLIAILNFNCEEEAVVPLKSSFPFEVNADYETTAFVNTPIDAVFDMRPEHIVSSLEYSFSYEILKGEASISYPLAEKALIAREIYQVEDLRLKTSIVPKSKGEIIVEFTFFDQEGETSMKIIEINVDNTDFKFNVASSSNELTVGQSMDFNFAIDELVGDSNFDISYAFTGVSGEFKNANDVVLRPNQNYDVDNTFKWTFKGVEQGTTEITFKVRNQFGVEKTKTIPIEAVPVDFDFSVEPVGSVFELGDKIPFEITMDAPNSLNYEIKFEANTDGIISVLNEDTNEGVFVEINNTKFILKYEPSISGNAVVNFIIRGSNGVEKTKSVNFQITEKPEITGIDIDDRFHSSIDDIPMPFPRPNCVISGPNRERSFKILIRWKKAPNTSILSISLRINGQNRVGLFNPELSENSSEATYIYSECYQNLGDALIEATITDSRGEISEVFQQTL